MIVLCIDSGTVVRVFPVRGRSIRAVREEEKENEEPDSQASGCSQAYLIRSQKLLNCIHRKVMMQRGRGSKMILWKISSRDSSFSAEKLSNFKFLKEMLQQRVDGGWNQTKQNQSYRTKD